MLLVGMAVKTTICHSVNLVSVNHEYNNWPVLLGFPNTSEKLEIQLHIPVNKGLWHMPIFDAKPDDLALLVTLCGAVHHLLRHEIVTTSPLSSMMPLEGLVPLKTNNVDCRVFFHTDGSSTRVYKYYDSEQTSWYHNMEFNVTVIHESNIVHGDVRVCNIY